MGEKNTPVVYFDSSAEAEAMLERCGFSIGRLQAEAPRGVMHGDYDIQKWRNLSADDRAELHGVFQRHGRDGFVTITLSPSCPPLAARALRTQRTKEPPHAE